MNGTTLKIAMESHFPFYIPAKYSGSDIFLLNATSQVLNFKYEIIRSVDGAWGSHDGTRWNGMIGMLIRQEADAALSGMTMTLDRSEVVDYSMPYAFDRTTYVTKVPPSKSKTMALFLPFTIEVWIAYVLAIVVVAIILQQLQNLCIKVKKRQRDINAEKSKMSLYNSLLYVFRTIVGQGGYDTEEESCRILLTGWWLAIIIIVTAYQGLLMSYLVDPGVGQAIDTLHGLVEAIETNTIAAGTIKDSAEYNMFKYSDEDYLKIIYTSIESSEKAWPVHHDVEGLKLVFEEKYAYIAGEMTVEADLRNPNNFVFAKDNFVSYGYAIAFRKGFPHVELFTRKIHQLTQAGIMNFWLKNMIRMNQVLQDVDQDTHVLTINDLQGAFVLLGIGLVVSFVVFLAEILSSKFKRNLNGKCSSVELNT